MSREFCEQYQDTIEAVEEHWPGFWTGLAEEFRRVLESHVTTRGAVVREFPAQRETGAQAAVPTRDAAAGTPPAGRREVAVQVEPGDWLPDLDSSKEDGEAPRTVSPWGDPTPRKASQARAGESAAATPTAMPDSTSQKRGCWNCGSRDHLARECPRQRSGEFCFRCGTRGYTVKSCPYCGDGWRAQGPYVQGRGHEGPEPVRGRRARSDARPAPY